MDELTEIDIDILELDTNFHQSKSEFCTIYLF